jgi:hypothetical protein
MRRTAFDGCVALQIKIGTVGIAQPAVDHKARAAVARFVSDIPTVTNI